MVQLVRHPQTKERDTDRPHLNHRATSRLYCLCDTRRNGPNYGTARASRKVIRIFGMLRGDEFAPICPRCEPHQINDSQLRRTAITRQDAYGQSNHGNEGRIVEDPRFRSI